MYPLLPVTASRMAAQHTRTRCVDHFLVLESRRTEPLALHNAAIEAKQSGIGGRIPVRTKPIQTTSRRQVVRAPSSARDWSRGSAISYPGRLGAVDLLRGTTHSRRLVAVALEDKAVRDAILVAADGALIEPTRESNADTPTRRRSTTLATTYQPLTREQLTSDQSSLTLLDNS